jgi:hypothetical protein
MLFVLFATAVVLTLRFGLGCLKMPIPYDALKVSKAAIVTARLLSAGFLVPPLPGLVAPFLYWLNAPLPFGVLFCVPGLLVIHRLRGRLEIRGNQAKPVMAWLDRGVLAGWVAGGSAIVWWSLTTLPLLVTTSHL